MVLATEWCVFQAGIMSSDYDLFITLNVPLCVPGSKHYRQDHIVWDLFNWLDVWSRQNFLLLL